ncbi:MAG: hypothetical protein P4K83_00260 [Terracidiphilus sp.]|nr:hypothetical protein [Terracidiphilus sp.]
MRRLKGIRQVGAMVAVAGMLTAGAWTLESQETSQDASQDTGRDAGKDKSQHLGKPMDLKPDPPGVKRNHRLILKDGSFQLVREYQVAGNRVRYVSAERSGEWEELPAELVDWEATRKWERDHTGAGTAGSEDELSPAMKEARAIDKEETDERNDEKARMPEVAKGLELPDADGVFVLDTYQGKPELVELIPVDLNMSQKTKRGVNMLNPLAGQKTSLELEGAHAKVHLHVNDPAIYLSLDVGDEKEPVLTNTFKVDTTGTREAANRNHGAHSEKSGFAIVKVDERRAVRIVGAIHVNPLGKVTQDENVISAKGEVLPGKHWLKIVPDEKLAVGEYALVEILSASEINQMVWDFRVDPRAGRNPGSIGPIEKSASSY